MLSIENLKAKIDDKKILKGLNLNIKPGEVHAIMGPNGSGKSTLSNILYGKKGYEINGNVTVGKVCGFDLSKFNLISGNKFAPKLKNKPSLLSETEIAFKLNLYGANRIIKKQKILNLTVQKSGTCLGVIQWLGIQIFKDIEYQNKPGEIISHWPTPIYMFESPKAVIAGDVIKIRASLVKDAIWFQYIE